MIELSDGAQELFGRAAGVVSKDGAASPHEAPRRRPRRLGNAGPRPPRLVKIFERTCLPEVTLPVMASSSACILPHNDRYSPSVWEQEVEGKRPMRWKQLLAYITGSVDQELLLRNESLVTENCMLRQQIRGRVRLSDSDRKTLAVIGKKLGKQALEEVATIVNPDTILAWHRKLVAQKCDGFQRRKSPGRRKIDADLEALVVRLAREKRTWGYDRIVGALRHVGYTISNQTVGNILKRHGIPPAPTRKKTTTWSDFIRVHMDVLVATDFFTTEVWTPCGLVTDYVLFFIHLASRRVHVAGMTSHPDQRWMVQIARNVTMVAWAFLTPGQYLIHDRDGKFCPAFKQTIDVASVTRVVLPPKSPDLNAYAERWVRSVKDEVLSQLILFGERSLRHALPQYEAHYHAERPHQGKGNVVLTPLLAQGTTRKTHEGAPLTTQHERRGADSLRGLGSIRCCERLGGLLKYYYREAA